MNNTNLTLGAIIGDTIGSIYEFHPKKNVNFKFFDESMEYTDDTVMTIAVMNWLNSGDYSHSNLVKYMQKWGRKYRYPMGSYGGNFSNWLDSYDPQPYRSWGNGSAMRVSPVGFYFDTLKETLRMAAISAEVSHNHPEGIKGAQATAAAIFLARNGKSKKEIKEYVTTNFGYDLDRTCDQIRPSYDFDVSCQGSVPEAIIAFLESTDFENAIRLVVSLGGDADTMGSITGSIAAAYYKEIPSEIYSFVWDKLPNDMKTVVEAFGKKESAKAMSVSVLDWDAQGWLQRFNYAVRVHDVAAIHELRIEVYRHTVECVNSGELSLPCKDSLRESTKFYKRELEQVEYPQSFDTVVKVVNEDCLLAAKSLMERGLNPAVLNMASRQRPGGAVIKGAGAQEENIFRRSNLFCSLYQFTLFASQYGVTISDHQYPLDRNWGGVYSKGVSIFRGTESQGYPLLDKAYSVDIVSVAALNRPEVDSNNLMAAEMVEATKNKMRTIFRIALDNGNDSLVLSAFGCGAYHNPPKQIASIFHEIIDEAEFKGKFKEICFAIIDDHNSKREHNPEGNYLPFKEEFE